MNQKSTDLNWFLSRRSSSFGSGRLELNCWRKFTLASISSSWGRIEHKMVKESLNVPLSLAKMFKFGCHFCLINLARSINTCRLWPMVRCSSVEQDFFSVSLMLIDCSFFSSNKLGDGALVLISIFGQQKRSVMSLMISIWFWLSWRSNWKVSMSRTKYSKFGCLDDFLIIWRIFLFSCWTASSSRDSRGK